MTTLAELVAAEPAADRGIATQIDHDAGVWRYVMELADPAAGVDVEWFDITDLGPDRSPCGYDLSRGADEYDGPYRASIVHIDLIADDDRYAPWNPDTSGLFGTHVPLGAGLLMRAGFVRVVADTVVEWNPRWCGKVERWGDATYARGNLRWHRITCRDLLSSLVAQPIGATVEENWSERVAFVLAGWSYGTEIYGATFIGGSDVLTVPARTAQTSALAELKATLDPAGLIYYTDRRGVLIIRPRHDDTFHAAAFDPGGASGTPWTERPAVLYSHLAEDGHPGTLDLAAYATDSRISEPFGFWDTEDAVRNHVVVTVSGSTEYDDDNPTSIQRHERRTLQLSWIAPNDTVAAAILGYRANATVEAVPLHATVDLHGFHPGPAGGDYYDTVDIQSQTQFGRSVVTGTGILRHYSEQVAPRPGGVSWGITSTVDITAVDVSDQLNPPEDLTLDDVTDTSAEFSWTNPSQTITPTNVQVRMLGHSDLWTEFVYPITTRTWHGLDPESDYTFQVRLLRRVDGLVTHFSAATSLDFTTLEAELPVVEIDDDGDGTATLPDPDPGCDVEWKLESSDDGTTWTLVDTDTITAPPYTVDLSGYTFDPTLLYKVCSRELCPAAGAWTCSNLFAGACSDPPALADPPFDADLVAYWPGICPPDDIVEAISEEVATHGPNFDTFAIDGDGNIVLVADGEGVIAYGVGPAAADAVTGDATLACKVIVSSQPDDPVTLFAVAGLTIEALAEGANWTVRGSAYEEGAGVTTITPATLELDFGAWYDIALVHDVAAGDLFLYVNGGEEASALATVGARHNSGIFQIGQSDNGIITNCALWDVVIAPEDLPGYVPGLALPPAILALSPLSYWTLAGDDAFTLHDFGSLGHDLTNSGSFPLDVEPGGDGYNYPRIVGGAAEHFTGVDDIAYEPQNASGLTVFYLVKGKPGGDGGISYQTVMKLDNAGNGSWRHAISTGTASGYFARTITSAGGTARTRTDTGTMAADTWHLCITRFAGTATGFPGVRLNGSNITGSTGGTGSANSNSTQPVRLYGHGGSTGRFLGTLAHVAIFAGQLSDADCAILEAAAATDGW